MCSSHFSLDRRPPAAEFPSAGFSLGSASGAYAAPSVSEVFGRIFLCRKTSQKRNTSKKTHCFYSIPGPKMCSSHFSLDRRPPAAEFPSAGFSLSSASGAYAAPSVSAVFGRIFLCRKSPQSPPVSLSAFSFARRRSLPAPFLSLLSLFLLSLIIYRFRLKALLLIEIYK